MADEITLDTISLPKDLEWVDEFNWDKVQQTTVYGATGSLFIQEGVKQAGRPITLVGKEDMGWITRETAVLLLAKKNTASLEMSLVLSDNRTFNVMFRQADGGLDIQSVKGYGELESGSFFKVNAIRLMEIPE